MQQQERATLRQLPLQQNRGFMLPLLAAVGGGSAAAGGATIAALGATAASLALRPKPPPPPTPPSQSQDITRPSSSFLAPGQGSFNGTFFGGASSAGGSTFGGSSSPSSRSMFGA